MASESRPVGHTTDDEHCVCDPELYVTCPHCDDDDEESSGCWRCGAGKYPGLIPWDGIDQHATLVVVHREMSR
jgi:hypothetical protein